MADTTDNEIIEISSDGGDQDHLQPANEAEADGTTNTHTSLTSLLPFQRAAVEQLLEEDGLCVLAPGLGLHQILAVLLQLQDNRLRQPGQAGTAIIIGSNPSQRQALRQELARIDPTVQQRVADINNGQQFPAEVTSDVPLQQRLEMYRSHSCVFVTTRILVVDLLSGRLDGGGIAGIYVLNAHRVTENCGESFAVRLFKTANTSGFVRGFSDIPSSLAGEFSKAEKVMKALFIRRMYLWPRFQAQIQDDLEAAPPQLVELSQPLSPGCALAYEAISDLMDACVKELRRSEKLDTTDLTASSGLFKSFDDCIRRQLASVWHTVSPKTKQIVADLKTLRTLAQHLLRFDAVSFLAYLETLRVTESTKCAWLFHSAAHTLFEAAKSRVYTLAKPGSGGAAGAQKRARELMEAKDKDIALTTTTTNAAPVVQPVLDEAPKWRLLREVLAEVEVERAALLSAAEQDKKSGSTEIAQSKAAAATAPVLVFCQDTFTAAQLKEVVKEEDGGMALLRKLYKEFLQAKLDSGSLKTKRGAATTTNAQQQQQQFQPGGSSSSGPTSTRMMGSLKPGEQAALAKEAKAITGTTKTTAKNPQQQTGKGRGRKKATAAIDAATAITNKALNLKPNTTTATTANTTSNTKHNQQQQEGEAEEDNSESVVFVPLDSHDTFALWQHRPAFIIVFDPDVALTRTIELYRAQHKDSPLRVYLLRYEDSPEMDRYQAAVVRERSAFEGLIKAKEIMVMPKVTTLLPTPALPAIGGSNTAASGSVGLAITSGEIAAIGSAANALTRNAGGRLLNNNNKPTPLKVVVDVREFMSPLPAVLHAKGMHLVPLTLEVGDYILSPDIVVERKSLSDLKGSLISGRLYTQAEAMTKHYKIAVLLVEFDGDSAFALQAQSEVGDDVQVYSLTSRLVLLCLHFPRLRLIWSRSLHATADTFKALKANQEDPDPIAAATVGVPMEAEGAAPTSMLNESALEVLRRLPGITDANWRAVMREAGSLAGLVSVPVERLAEAMGGQAAAKRLREFLVQDAKAMFKAM